MRVARLDAHRTARGTLRRIISSSRRSVVSAEPRARGATRRVAHRARRRVDMSSDDDADARARSRARGSSAQERFLLERASSGLAGREALARFVEPPAMVTRARDKAAGARERCDAVERRGDGAGARGGGRARDESRFVILFARGG